MTKYPCGHDTPVILLNADVMAYIEYEEWKDDTGYNGKKTECFGCYCQRRRAEDIDQSKGKAFTCAFPCNAQLIGLEAWQEHMRKVHKDQHFCSASLKFDTVLESGHAPWVSCDHWENHPGNHKGLFYEWENTGKEETIADPIYHYRMTNALMASLKASILEKK